MRRSVATRSKGHYLPAATHGQLQKSIKSIGARSTLFAHFLAKNWVQPGDDGLLTPKNNGYFWRSYNHPMTILFLHGWTSVPGGTKPTFLKNHGHTVINPKLPDDDFAEAVRIAQAEFDNANPRSWWDHQGVAQWR